MAGLALTSPHTLPSSCQTLGHNFTSVRWNLPPGRGGGGGDGNVYEMAAKNLIVICYRGF